MVLLPDLAWAAFLSRWRRPLPSRRLGVLIVAAVGAGAILFAWLVQEPGRWPFDAFSDSFEIVAAGYSTGEVVSARAETWHTPPQGLLDVVLVIADRFAHFFAIGAADYSPLHWLGSLAFFVPTYALAAWLCVALWRGDSGFGAAEQRVFLAAIGAIFSYATFHGLVQIDFDWRYRNPVLPHLILIASAGATDLLRRMSGHRLVGASAAESSNWQPRHRISGLPSIFQTARSGPRRP